MRLPNLRTSPPSSPTAPSFLIPMLLRRVAHNKEVPLKVRVAVWFAQTPLLDESSWLMFKWRTGVTLDPKKLDALSAIGHIQQPILFISSEHDWLAPPENIRRMYEAALNRQKALLVVPAAGHNTTYKAAPQQYETAVLEFLKKVLPGE